MSVCFDTSEGHTSVSVRSSSHLTSIYQWLQDLPLPAPDIPRKRKRQPIASNRKALNTVSGNKISQQRMPPRREKCRSQLDGPQPTELGGRGKDSGSFEIFDENEGMVQGDEATPRPKRQRITADGVYSLPPSSATSASEASNKSERSRSPTKMAELHNLVDPLHFEVLPDLGQIQSLHPLYKRVDLFRSLRRFSQGLDVLDSNTKVHSRLSFHAAPAVNDGLT